jgi:hypothetical protein
MSAQLVELKWNEAAGGDDREVFDPALPQQKSSSFRKQQPGIYECSDAGSLELLWTDREGAAQYSMNRAVVGIDSDTNSCARGIQENVVCLITRTSVELLLASLLCVGRASMQQSS